MSNLIANGIASTFCVIKNSWSILAAALIFSLIVSSCSSTRSVRPWKPYTSKADMDYGEFERQSSDSEEYYGNEEPSENIKNQTEIEKPKQIAQEFKLQQNKATTESQEQNTKRKIPTLREQLKEIREEQQVIKGKVENLQNDVIDIKNSLEEIKGAINLSKKDCSKASPNMESKTEKGENNLKANQSPGMPVKGYILSDEEANEKQIDKPAPKQDLKKAKKSKNAANSVKDNKSVGYNENRKNESYKPQNNSSPTATESGSETLSAAESAIASGNYQEAIETLSRTTEKEKNPSVINNCNYLFGESYFGLEQYDKAINYFGKVLNSGSVDMKENAQIMIAESHIRSGQIPKAKTAYQQLIDKFPQSELIPRARKMLQQL